MNNNRIKVLTRSDIIQIGKDKNENIIDNNITNTKIFVKILCDKLSDIITEYKKYKTNNPDEINELNQETCDLFIILDQIPYNIEEIIRIDKQGHCINLLLTLKDENISSIEDINCIDNFKNALKCKLNNDNNLMLSTFRELNIEDIDNLDNIFNQIKSIIIDVGID